LCAAQIAERVHSTKSAVIRKAKASGIRLAGSGFEITHWTEAEDERLAVMLETSASIADTRAEFPDRTYDAIRRRRYALRARYPGRFPPPAPPKPPVRKPEAAASARPPRVPRPGAEPGPNAVQFLDR